MITKPVSMEISLPSGGVCQLSECKIENAITWSKPFLFSNRRKLEILVRKKKIKDILGISD